MSSEQSKSEIVVVQQPVPKKIIKEKERNNNLEAKLEQTINELDELKLEMKKLSKCSLVKLQPLIEDNITEKQCSNGEQSIGENEVMKVKNNKESIVELFNKKVRGKKFDKDVNNNHCGAEGHVLEKAMEAIEV